MESYQKAAAVAALGLGAFSGCAGKVETTDLMHILPAGPDGGAIDGGKDAGTLDAATDADVAENVSLTRAQFAKSLVGDVLGLKLSGQECSSSFSDIPGNSELCVAAELLNKRGAMTGYKDSNGNPTGQWGPEDPVTRSQIWKAVTKGVGFADYPAQCVKNYPDLDPAAWYTNFAGSLCDHGLYPEAPGQNLRPADSETLQGWATFKAGIENYLTADSTRFNSAEAVESVILGKDSFTSLECGPSFSDIQPNSIQCVITDDLVKAGLLSGFPDGKFRPDSNLNLAEMSKLYANSGDLHGNGVPCFLGSHDTWYYSYAELLCENGIIAPDANMASTPARRLLFESAWKVRENK